MGKFYRDGLGHQYEIVANLEQRSSVNNGINVFILVMCNRLYKTIHGQRPRRAENLLHGFDHEEVSVNLSLGIESK